MSAILFIDKVDVKLCLVKHKTLIHLNLIIKILCFIYLNKHFFNVCRSFEIKVK